MTEFLKMIVPVIITKTGYEKKFIQGEAKEALWTMVLKTRSFYLLDQLTQGSNSKNKDVSLECLAHIPQCVKVNIDSNVNPENIWSFVEFLDQSLWDPVPKVKSAGQSSAKLLKEALGSEEKIIELC